MKKIFLLLGAALMLSSCSQTFYQVYDVETEHLKKTSDALVYSNDDCCMYYNLWCNTGNVGFVFENTSNREIYLDLSRSFYINNGMAHDYYEEGSQSSSVMVTNMVGSQVNVSGTYREGTYLPDLWNPGHIRKGYAVNAQNAVSSTHSVTKVMPRFICIPPKSSKIIQGFNISSYVFKKVDDKKFLFPRKESQLVEYNADNTPLTFRNRIVYGYSKENAETIVIDHEFWVKSVQNFTEKKFIQKNEYINGYYTNYKEPTEYQKAPQKFYNMYVHKRF